MTIRDFDARSEDMDALFPNLLAAGVLAVIGAGVGLWLTRLAAHRTVAQPLAMALDDEVRLLVGVLSDIRRLPYLTSLTAADFASAANGRLWDAIVRAADPELAVLGDEPTEAQCAEAGARLTDRADQYHAQLHHILRSSATARVDLARLAELAARSAGDRLDDGAVVESGQAVLLTGTGRNTLAGGGLVLPTKTPDSTDPATPPLARVLVAPSKWRYAMTGAATAATTSTAWGLLSAGGFSGVAMWFALAAFTVLVGGCVVLSLVDLDTFYIDLRTFLLTGAAGWLLTIIAVSVLGAWTRAVAGLVVVAATAVLFELINRAFRAVRGFDAQGFGDTLVLVLTAGIPPALSGDWTLGARATLAGLLCVIVGWVLGRILGKLAPRSPLAFGPYLAAGWVVAWVWSVAAGA